MKTALCTCMMDMWELFTPMLPLFPLSTVRHCFNTLYGTVIPRTSIGITWRIYVKGMKGIGQSITDSDVHQRSRKSVNKATTCYLKVQTSPISLFSFHQRRPYETFFGLSWHVSRAQVLPSRCSQRFYCTTVNASKRSTISALFLSRWKLRRRSRNPTTIWFISTILPNHDEHTGCASPFCLSELSRYIFTYGRSSVVHKSSTIFSICSLNTLSHCIRHLFFKYIFWALLPTGTPAATGRKVLQLRSRQYSTKQLIYIRIAGTLPLHLETLTRPCTLQSHPLALLHSSLSSNLTRL